MTDLPRPATWWREAATGAAVVVSCTAEVADGGGTVVVYRPPVGSPAAELGVSGQELLDACNAPVPLTACPAADFLARFTPRDTP